MHVRHSVLIRPCVLAILAALSGCSGDTERTKSSGSSDAGSSGATGASVAGAPGSSASGATNAGAPPSGDDNEPTSAAVEQLMACVADEPCDPSFVQLVEAFSRNFSKEQLRCPLESMRDRKPGRYIGTTSGSQDTVKNIVVITQAGEARLATETFRAGPGVVASQLVAGMRCRLKPAAYFTTCLAALESEEPADNDVAWQCLFGSTSSDPGPIPWLEDCQSEPELQCE